ncbi:LysR family transcriptional regulator [Paenarthrobacter ureafaciens]|uniref:LysR family transcriptional regulator n=1 Tax=Paenarthrobacter ureafaciens TaxID=37931 RepID=UPI00196A4C74|nr:LysR family transcriptional regulator [Paenarthrobacter ureafaciens]MCX8453593.1 LysR family transcriptional regulator [Paenarthrobacter ureafaciens]MCY0973252.1 LysR family transcriptional regulator [Paenarthrobacter ureafaciens]
MAETPLGHRSIELSWHGLGAPFAVDVPGPESDTGKHEIFAVFHRHSKPGQSVGSFDRAPAAGQPKRHETPVRLGIVRFDLRRMQILRELAHRGTVSSVADALSYSSSAISQQLAVLEKEIGAPLLISDGRRVRLTPQAEILVQHTSKILEHLESTEAQIAASMGTVVGTVRLATIQSIALVCVPEILDGLQRTFPGLSVQLTQAEPEVAVPGLLARQFDLVCDDAFAEFPPVRASDIDLEPLAVDPMRVAFREPPPGRSALEAKLGDFSDHPWVMELPGSPGREWAVAVCRRAGFEPRVVHQTSDALVQAELVARGHAVAFLPDLLWFERQPTFHLRWMDPSHTRTIMTTCRAGSQEHPSIVAVRQACRQAIEASRPPVTDR